MTLQMAECESEMEEHELKIELLRKQLLLARDAQEQCKEKKLNLQNKVSGLFCFVLFCFLEAQNIEELFFFGLFIANIEELCFVVLFWVFLRGGGLFRSDKSMKWSENL